jgi:hypothetical protein
MTADPGRRPGEPDELHTARPLPMEILDRIGCQIVGWSELKRSPLGAVLLREL